ncbi:MAG: PadR family transcriptional regulator [Bacillus sp. (in: firmicutes)]
MDDRFKRLRHSMEKNTFNELHFSERHQKSILKKINEQKESEEDILLAVMQLLIHEKTGHELAQLLRGRGIRKFEDNEGFLYTLLHRLEHGNCLQTRWDETEIKYYQLNDKGRKLLRKAEKKQTKKLPILKGLLEG